MSKDDNEKALPKRTAEEREKDRIRYYHKMIWASLCDLRKWIHEAQTHDVSIGKIAEHDLEPLLAEIKRVGGFKW